jgi:toluene monooxygenase system ferredoxin subunit
MNWSTASSEDHAEAILARASFFRRMTPEQRAVLASLTELQELPAGTEIYKVGDEASFLYVLVDGMVRFSLPMGQRQATAGEIIRRGEVFGWAALIEGAQRRIATASCITACTALAIDGRLLIRLMANDHSLGYAVMREVSLLISSTLTAYAAG